MQGERQEQSYVSRNSRAKLNYGADPPAFTIYKKGKKFTRPKPRLVLGRKLNKPIIIM